MATTSLPKQQRDIGRGRWIAAGVAVIVVAILAALALNRPATSPTSGATTVSVTTGSITATVSGTGSIAAEQTLDLAFSSSGTVTEVLVEEGDAVAAGQPLARLDTRDLELQVASVAASLESAQARLEQQQQGNATRSCARAAPPPILPARRPASTRPGPTWPS